MFPPGHAQPQDPDAPIRATDNDAALARLSAVKKNYLQDAFVKDLVPRAHLQPSRPPLINIGTYVRSHAIDLLVGEWLQMAKASGTKVQIVSLGAGSDTRFWRIETGPAKDELAKYIEIDFTEVTTKKAMAIRKSKQMNSALGDPEKVQVAGGGTGLRSPKYHLIPADLRAPPTDSLGPVLTAGESTEGGPLLSPSLPTLIIFECVLAYMSPEASARLLRWFVDYSSTGPEGGGILGCLVYEMFNLHDAFGRVMVSNLQARYVSIPGAEPFTTLESLSKRLTDEGFSAARALTLREIRRAYIEQSELERISKLEFLDETEELDLVLEHYAISWGLYLQNPGSSSSWGHWGLKQQRL
ncbi:hypothetical protein D9611_000286 [Ephemerocybe angulata]|uniref:Leucine carboxyl methyltransferase 1 n=1 Tax=Ephemerocybe angulata TaxID=980116 RepID=A0A8H5BMR9_9AGAR|nr:hypothetical protein D9611_000286 [Tulosesus angulatus]